jgi:RNA polymerase-binding protein DksA
MAKKPTQKDLEELRSSLVNARAALTGDINQLESEALEPGGAPAAAEGDTGAHHQEFSLELLERDGLTLREVEEALGRIEEGVYGRCEGCEIWIPKTRLKAVPYARHCIECQREVESQGW